LFKNEDFSIDTISELLAQSIIAVKSKIFIYENILLKSVRQRQLQLSAKKGSN
jgi:hypothetical protein